MLASSSERDYWNDSQRISRVFSSMTGEYACTTVILWCEYARGRFLGLSAAHKKDQLRRI